MFYGFEISPMGCCHYEANSKKTACEYRYIQKGNTYFNTVGSLFIFYLKNDSV